MGNSVPDNTAAFDLANNDGKDYMGMLFWRPFQAFGGSENTKGFGLGLMGSYGTTRGNVLDTFKSTAQATIFTYNSGVYAVGGRYRIVPQASYYNGPFSLYGEWVENWQEIGRNVTVVGQPQSLTDGISDQSWQISAAYVLTGEDASYTGVKPRHDFNPFIGDWGAFEVAARMDQLLVDRSAFDLGYADPAKSVRQATEWAIGFNWYLNRNVKFMVDYARTSFTLGASGGHNRPKESAILTELQLAY